MFKDILYALKLCLFATYNKVRYYRECKHADKDLIPKDTIYCYSSDRKRCPYFKSLPYTENYEFGAWCSYMNDTDWDTLWDGCKICDIGYPDEADE